MSELLKKIKAAQGLLDRMNKSPQEPITVTAQAMVVGWAIDEYLERMVEEDSLVPLMQAYLVYGSDAVCRELAKSERYARAAARLWVRGSK